MKSWMHVKRNVVYTQAWGCLLCLHLRHTAIYVGRFDGDSLRVEVWTDTEWFRVRWPRPAWIKPLWSFRRR